MPLALVHNPPLLIVSGPRFVNIEWMIFYEGMGFKLVSSFHNRVKFLIPGPLESALGMPAKNQVFHICLAGPTVSSDWLLIQNLKSQNQVTLVEHVRLLSRNSVLLKVDVLILECKENGGLGLRIVSFLKRYFPELCVVLVNGGLTQKQIAAAFREGVQDYFPDPYDVQLLTERIHVLATNVRSKNRKSNGS